MLKSFEPDPGSLNSGWCLLYATIFEVPGLGRQLDPALLGKLVHRRLVRLERVLEAHGGRQIRETASGLLAGFASADDAVVAACEMQRRCAVVPQVADTQIALKIGIHPSDSAATLPGEADAGELAAIEMAMALDGSGVVVAETMLGSLSDTLRNATQPVSGTVVHRVDWNALPLMPARPVDKPVVSLPVAQGKARSDAKSPALILRQGKTRLRFNAEHPSITVGREPDNDVSVPLGQVSRRHCRIFQRQGSYVLVDVSLNGTYVLNGDGKRQRVHNSMVTLVGRGRLCFGALGGSDCFEFEIVGA